LDKRLAIVGSETLLGREIREMLRSEDVPVQVSLVAGGGGEAKVLTEDDAEAVIMADLQSDAVTGADIVALCGSVESSKQTIALLRRAHSKARVIDATGALEDVPAALLRGPLAIDEKIEHAEGAIEVIAHPAALALALFFRNLAASARIVRSVVNVFEPASERGQAGIDEMQRQTVSLLSFKPLPKDVFDAQVSFNMLAAWGEEAATPLDAVEARIERDLATLLGSATTARLPSLRLIQAPVFHGYSMSAWVEFDSSVDVGDLARHLNGKNIDVRGEGLEPPSNVGIAGQGGIAVGAIAVDRNDARACWFWVVADNLRITAENCVEIIRETAA